MHLILSLIFFVRVVAVAPFDLFPRHPERALEHGVAMVLAAGGGVSEQDLAKRMHHESGGWRDARPGVVWYDANGKKHIGKPRRWPHDPAKFPKLPHYICGVMQAMARTPRECVAWQRDLVLAYRTAADMQRAWFSFCEKIGRRGGRVRPCAEAGYAGGVAAARNA